MMRLSPSFRLSATFSGGKAPVWWWRGIAKKTARLFAVRRGSAWIQAFGDIYPRLCEGPLLGYTLTSLTGPVEPTQEAPPEPADLEKCGLPNGKAL